MITHATGTFELKTWDEKPYQEIGGGAKLTRASVTQSFHGDIEGEGAVEYLMMYPDESSARFVGLQRVVGRIGGREGSFVLQLGGRFEDGTVKATWSVVPGSGTGDLRGLRGEGNFTAPLGQTASVTLDYEIEGESA
ncbi:MAG TPA: DUF3224 domain-containing protein [Chloroflexota bacterium]|nr:DUF3224 domain-containing protein [Chloroflexota bacterium]